MPIRKNYKGETKITSDRKVKQLMDLIEEFKGQESEEVIRQLLEILIEPPLVTRASDVGRGYHSASCTVRYPRSWDGWIASLVEALKLTKSDIMRASMFLGLVILTTHVNNSEVRSKDIEFFLDVAKNIRLEEIYNSKRNALKNWLSSTKDFDRRNKIYEIAQKMGINLDDF